LNIPGAGGGGSGDMTAAEYDTDANSAADNADTATIADAVTGFTPASGSLTLSGADAITLTTTAGTSLTLPTTGTLATTGDISDSLTALLAAGEDGVALADSSGVVAGSYTTGFDFAAHTTADVVQTAEQGQDLVGAMFTGNTETNITATYQDADGTIDLVIADSYPLLTDTVLIYSFGAGGGLAGDTALFLTTLDQVHGHVKIYEDSLQLGKIETYISSGDTLRFSLVYGDTIFDADGTLVTIAADEGVTNTTSFSISTLRERNYIWIDVLSVVAGKKPIVFRCDLYGYIKRN